MRTRINPVTAEENKLKQNAELWAKTSPKEAVLLPYRSCSELVFVQTEKQEPNLFNNNSTKFYHSQEGALKEANKWFSQLDLKLIDALYIYGVGLGYYFDAAKNWLETNPAHHLIFLEDDIDVIYRLFQTEKGTELLQHDQVDVYYFKDLEDQDTILETLYWNLMTTRSGVSALKLYQEQKPEFFDELQHKILFDIANKDALVDEYLKYGAGFFRNFYPNLKFLSKARWGNALFGKFSKVPAIICGAGPSLQKNLPMLKSLTSKALVFAGGSALNVLDAQGLLPHFGAGIDPNPDQYRRLSTHTSLNMPFFYRNRMFHQALQQVKGELLYISGSGGYDVSDWFEEKFEITAEFFDEGHNIVNFCTELACRLGCNPIIYIGVDLAYTGMQLYAPGVLSDATVNEKELLEEEDIDKRVLNRKDIYGNPTYTLWKWIAESQWIGEFSSEHTDHLFINATEGGIGFPGVANMTLEKTAKQYLTQEFDLPKRIQKEVNNASLPQVTKEKVDQALQDLYDSLKRCVEDLNILIEEGSTIIQRILSENEVPTITQTGKAALYETELADEPAYQYVLDIFNAVYSRVLNRDLTRISNIADDAQRTIKKLEINNKKLSFLRDVASVNIEIINWGAAGPPIPPAKGPKALWKPERG